MSPASDVAERIAIAGGVSRVASALGVSYVSVWTWATGRITPRAENLARLWALPVAERPAPLRRQPHRRRDVRDFSKPARLITTAGGTARVASALGVSSGAVRAWLRGWAWPTAEHMAQLEALPAKPRLKGGRPVIPPGPESALVDQVVLRVGSVSEAARRLGICRSTMQRYLTRKRAVIPAVLERARELLGS